MKILATAYYEFLKNIRDIKMVAILLIFPIVTVYILGNAVGTFFTTDVTDKIPVGYVSHDKGDLGIAFDKFLENKEIKERLEIVRYDGKDLGQKAIGDGEIDGLIYLPSQLSEGLARGEHQRITVSGKKNVELVESMIQGFVSSYNSVHAVITVSGNPVLPKQEGSIERIHYTKNAAMPSMVDYYSVLTLLQVLIIGGIFGVFIVTKNTNSDMHIRTHSLPVSKWALMWGRILGSISYLFLTSLIVMLFTKFVYKANWNGNLLIILGTLILFSAITVGIGILIGLLVPKSSTALMMVLLLMVFFGVVSGAISPMSTGGLGIISPNFHAKILIFGTIYGYSKQIMQEAALWLGSFMAVIYGIATIVIGRAKYDNI